MPGKISLYADALRLERWPRSLAFIPGVLAVIVLKPGLVSGISQPTLFVKAVLAFILTWLISTVNYIINEITDAPFDKFHPSKKNRPLVKKVIKRRYLLLLALGLTTIAIIVARLLFNLPFMFSLISLLAAGFLYNVPPLRIKDVPFLDSTLESANNPIRFMIGWLILDTHLAPLTLLLAWWAFGNFLMVGKRLAEKKFLTPEECNSYRLSLQRYSHKSLMGFMVFNSLAFMGTFTIFALQFKLNTFLFSLPFILIYLAMFMKKSLQDREGAEEPEKLLKNPYFAAYTIFLMVIFIISYMLK